MRKKILFIGLDVDNKAFHGTAIHEESGELWGFSCKPNIGSLVKKLHKLPSEGMELRICYEAGYLGFSLYRDLSSKGIHCDVIAPSHIPVVRGKKVKTDRLDSQKLAVYYKKGLLTTVHVPTAEEESHRDLIRSRDFMISQRKALQLHILSLCRRGRIEYQKSTGNKKYWTVSHVEWLECRANQSEELYLKKNLAFLISQFKQLTKQVELYDKEIEELASSEEYKQKVQSLLCYRGIRTKTAMVLITEIGDIRRFGHPRKLTSYAGMDLTEYSSGGKERKYHMTKMGNKHMRTAVIESCQMAYNLPRISADLRRRRTGIDPKLVDIANRCMNRLYKKGSRLFYGGKNKNKVKVACARELLGFIWESLRATA